jgi:hypothetical protein
MIAMAVSGALAGMVGMNEIAGVSGKLLLEFVSGAGFTGIAVALMGRNHPVGIVLASLLFGALFQGGAEVAFEVRGFSRDMVVMLQGFIVLFSGAMAYVIAPNWLGCSARVALPGRRMHRECAMDEALIGAMLASTTAGGHAADFVRAGRAVVRALGRGGHWAGRQDAVCRLCGGCGGCACRAPPRWRCWPPWAWHVVLSWMHGLGLCQPPGRSGGVRCGHQHHCRGA